ncbi:RelA/SpoT domain-containing protein [Candidatus Palauibacter sp.]|uniref:RelA/SpoT domain-containing protein n=1 Tax=Candidatus Palauibacter sp. TaxID=3101350 RepID=UPI003B026DCC
MDWIQPLYSRGEVDRAGKKLAVTGWVGNGRGEPDTRHELAVLNNWRAAHSFPLNTMQMGLRKRARSIEPDAIVSQRLKRAPATIAKLRRFPDMKLSRMQDIAGCRAILGSPVAVRELWSAHRRSKMKHQLIREVDYIQWPKPSGYRGVHLVYRYRSDRNDTYNGLRIEIQLRSKLQHAWATAVETAGAIRDQALKSSEGNADWLRFFALAGSWLAIKERSPVVPETPSDPVELRDSLVGLANDLNVVATLDDYRTFISYVPERLPSYCHYFLLERRPDQRSMAVRGFRKSQLTRAAGLYEEREEEIRGIDGAEVVLVAMDSVASLRAAYPNYLFDTDLFIKELDLATRRQVHLPGHPLHRR